MPTEAPGQKTASDPEVPDTIARRRPIALTHIAAESGQAEERTGLTTIGQSGKRNINEGLAAHNAQRKSRTKALKAKAAAEKAIPAEPLAGLTREQIEQFRSRSYTGAPKMDGMLGDRTPAFVNWLYKNHPKDAAVRYYARDIWPTE